MAVLATTGVATVGRINVRHCPICGESNGCAVALASESGLAQAECWCMQAEFSAAALSRVPEAARAAACICARCAAAAPD